MELVLGVLLRLPFLCPRQWPQRRAKDKVAVLNTDMLIMLAAAASVSLCYYLLLPRCGCKPAPATSHTWSSSVQRDGFKYTQHNSTLRGVKNHSGRVVY